MKPKILIFTDVAQLPWSRTAGPFRIATELRNNGYETLVIDHFLWMSVIDKQKIFDIIDRFVTTDLIAVGFSATFFQKKFFDDHVPFAAKIDNRVDTSLLTSPKIPYLVPLSREYMQELKNRVLKINPKVKFVLGGATKNFNDITDTVFDTYILGFADNSFINYIKYLDGKNPFFQFRTDGNKLILDKDPAATGFCVDHAVIDWRPEDIMIEGERVPIEISRGCIFKCTFCGYALNGKKKYDYVKSTDVLKLEMQKNYDNYGIKDYWFTDDTYNDTVDKVSSIRDMVKELPFDIKFRAYLRLDLLAAHPETVDMVNETGLEMTMLGIESLNYSNAKLVGKGIKAEKVTKTLNWLWNEKGWNKNVYVMTCIILGLPHDSIDNMGWMDHIDSTDFCSDNVCLNPLYISRNSSSLFQSTFDKEYSNYGYYFEGDDIWNWKNKNTGLDFLTIEQKVSKIKADFKNKNLTGLMHERHLNISKDQMYELTGKIYNLTDPSQKWKTLVFLYKERVQLIDNYFTRLMNL